MRKLLVTSLVTAVAGCRSRSRRRPARRLRPRAADPGLRAQLAEPRRGRRPHDRRRQPGLPALVRRRREDEAVEGLRPVQRQGLRVGRRVRGRAPARLHEGQVKWTVVPFNNSFRPGKKPFDFYITQVSYTPERARAVDFSKSYYFVNQAVVGRKGQPIAKVKSIAGLKPYKLGAQVGTTSYTYITRFIRPSSEPARLRHERRGRAGAQERPDRRDRRRPPDGVLRHRRPGRRRRDRRQAADEGHEGALRDGLPEGQHAPRVREPRARPLWRTGRSRSSRTRTSRKAGAPDLK